jgi:hypothetical protein
MSSGLQQRHFQQVPTKPNTMKRRVYQTSLANSNWARHCIADETYSTSYQTLTAKQALAMGSVRVPVEWSFAYLKQHYPLVASREKLKLFATRPLSIIQMGVLLAKNTYLLAQIFSGFYPNEVKEMAFELFLYKPQFKC